MKLSGFFFSIITISVLSLTALSAQTGTVRGKVSSSSDGEPMVGATVRLLAGSSVRGGAYTDVEGIYNIKAPAGSYSLIISYLSYISDTITDVSVTAGNVVYNESLLLEENAVREDLVVDIVAKRSEASETAFLAKKKNAINAVDGVTFDLVQRTGDANAAAAVQRVVGVSVEGGKYVYVRGLGDRYSKTMLNGSELPGLDPNRNTVQMDIFPSNLIDNIIVYKNFTPDLPGSFTGGLVDVRTKDFPSKFTLRVSGSLGYNTQASLRDDFLADPAYGGEALGMANEIRDMPTYIAEDLNGTLPRLTAFTLASEVASKGPQLAEAARSFQTSLAPTRRSSGLNQRYEISAGNQHLFGKQQDWGYKSIGYIVGLSYRRNFSYFERGQRNQYQLQSTSATILDPLAVLRGDRGEDEVLWGGLLKVSIKPAKDHKFSVNYMRNQSGTSYGQSFGGPFFSSGGDILLETRTAGYVERSISVLQAQGDHVFGPVKADWIVSQTDVRQYEPDFRLQANEIEFTNDGDTTYVINDGNGYTDPLRFYRDLNETNLDARVNFNIAIPGIKTSNKGNIKFGGAYTQKNRDFTESRFEIFEGLQGEGYQGDIDAYTAPDNLLSVPLDENGNLIIPELFRGHYYQDVTQPTNVYTADQLIWATYAMAELPLSNRIKAVFGARYEVTDAEIFPNDSSLLDDLRAENPTAGILDLQDLLPALNLIYNINEEMTLRGGYSRTLARPTVVEISPFQAPEFIGGPIRIGNPDLDRTLIDNFDLRWEWFFSLTEMVSASIFYKNFQNPIGLAQDFSTQNLRFRYDNRPSAFVTGLELELKKNFGFLGEGFEKLQVGANATFVLSELELLQQEIDRIRLLDPDRPTTIPLFGQSPYVFNAELAYIDREDLGLQASTSINVFGPRLFAVGGGAPDIYEQPRPALNFSISKDIGKYLSVRFRANNLLNPDFRFTQEFLGKEYVYQNNSIGRTFSLGVSVNIK